MDMNVVQDQILMRGLTEAQLARASRLPLQRVRNVLSGNEDSKVAEVSRICRVLNLDCELIVHRADCGA